jgi:hypothetical protein
LAAVEVLVRGCAAPTTAPALDATPLADGPFVSESIGLGAEALMPGSTLTVGSTRKGARASALGAMREGARASALGSTREGARASALGSTREGERDSAPDSARASGSDEGADVESSV